MVIKVVYKYNAPSPAPPKPPTKPSVSGSKEVSRGTPVVVPGKDKDLHTSLTPTGTPGTANYNPGLGAKNVLLKNERGEVHSGTVSGSGETLTYAGSPYDSSPVKGVVEQEVSRIAEKYPGYVAPNPQTQAYNIAQKLTPQPERVPETYPSWSGKQTDQEGGLNALAFAQEQGYYKGGLVASSAGPMPTSQMPVVKSLHERMGIPFGGGMGGENIPESAVSVGFSRLFERRGVKDTGGEKGSLEVVGGTVRDIPYEQLVSAPSGTIWTAIPKHKEVVESYIGEAILPSSNKMPTTLYDVTESGSALLPTSNDMPKNNTLFDVTEGGDALLPSSNVLSEREYLKSSIVPSLSEVSGAANYGLGLVLGVLGSKPKYNEYVSREWGLSKSEYESMPLWMQMGTSERASSLKGSIPFSRQREIEEQGMMKEAEIRAQLTKSEANVNMALISLEHPNIVAPGRGSSGVYDSSGALITSPSELSKISKDIGSDLRNLHSNIGLETQYQILNEGESRRVASDESMRLIGDVYIGASGGLEGGVMAGALIGGPAAPLTASVGGAAGMLIGSGVGLLTYYAGKEVGSQIESRSKPILLDYSKDEFTSSFVAGGLGRVGRFGTEFTGAYYTPSIAGGTISTGYGIYSLAKADTGAFGTKLFGVNAAYVKMPGQQGFAVGTNKNVWFSGGPSGIGFGSRGFKPFTEAAPKGSIFMVESSNRESGKLATNVLFDIAKRDPNFISTELTRAKAGLEVARLLEYQKGIYTAPLKISQAKNIVENVPVSAITNMEGVLSKYSEQGDILFRYKGSLPLIPQMSSEAKINLSELGYGEAKDVDIEIIHTPYSSLSKDQLRNELIEAGVKGGAKNLTPKKSGIVTESSEGKEVKLFDIIDRGEVNVEGKIIKGGKYRFGLDVEQGYVMLDKKPVQPLSEGNIRYLSTSISFQNVGGVGMVNPESFRMKDIYRFQEGTAPSLISSAKSNVETYLTGVKAQRQLDLFKSTRGNVEKPPLNTLGVKEWIGTYTHSGLKIPVFTLKKGVNYEGITKSFGVGFKEFKDFTLKEKIYYMSDAIKSGVFPSPSNIELSNLEHEVGHLTYSKKAAVARTIARKLPPSVNEKIGKEINDLGIVDNVAYIYGLTNQKKLNRQVQDEILAEYRSYKETGITGKSYNINFRKMPETVKFLEVVLKTPNTPIQKPKKESTMAFGSGDIEGGVDFTKLFNDKSLSRASGDSFYASSAAYGKMKPKFTKTPYYAVPSSGGSSYTSPYKSYSSYTPYTAPVSYDGYQPYTKPSTYKPYDGYTKYTPYTPYTPYPGYSEYYPYKPYKPYDSYRPFESYNPPRYPRGSDGVIWAPGGFLDGGGRRRGKRQRFVKAFVPSGGELFDLFGEGRSVTKKRTKTKRRRKK